MRETSASTPEQAALRDEFGLLAAALHDPAAGASTPDQAALAEALRTEYAALSTMLATVWYASLFRVSLLLGVVSAGGVALGFAAQAGKGTFTVFALVALPMALFLGLATFARTVELQREAYVYITGMNRIRRAMADAAPAIRKYLVLPVHDDVAGFYRSQGTGIRLRPPRFRLGLALAQTQGIVALINAAVAGIIGWIAIARFDANFAWAVATVDFVVVLGALLIYWSRSIAQLQAAIHPMFPTPLDEIDAPI